MVTRKSLVVIRSKTVIIKNMLGGIFVLFIYFTNTQGRKREPGMIPALKFCLRFIVTLCLIAVIAFMVMCAVLAVYLAVKGGISIRKISGDGEEE